MFTASLATALFKMAVHRKGGDRVPKCTGILLTEKRLQSGMYNRISYLETVIYMHSLHRKKKLRENVF